jgi:hypothetical protein
MMGKVGEMFVLAKLGAALASRKSEATIKQYRRAQIQLSYGVFGEDVKITLRPQGKGGGPSFLPPRPFQGLDDIAQHNLTFLVNMRRD